MSAITGIFHLQHNHSVPIEHGRFLMRELGDFPADDVQLWHKDNIFLGCHAQWITPESIGEQLPYYDSERQLAITADAIIDNRDELFDRLQVEMAQRKMISDSELILLAYRKWGEDSPRYLIGDFAYIIWDEKKQQLFGARDFSGTRTLYYYRDPQRFVFCTIIKPFFSLPYVEKRLNEQWLAEFLAVPGMHDTIDPSSTVFKNIEQVPPSHTITVANGRVSLSRYCRLDTREKLKLNSDEEYEEAFREVFQSAVTARLRTTRNVGAHLSGGLDSGSVVSFAARALHKENKQLHTFSYVPVDGFVDWTPRNRVADERPFIQSTVQYVGNISDHYLDFKEKSPLTEVNDWLDTMEMPYKFFENSFWLKGIYEKANEEGIGILLNGARGNWTVSWGPALDYQAMLLRQMKWVRFFQELNQYSKNIGVKRSRVMSAVGKKAFPFVRNLFKSNNIHPFPMLIHPEFARKTNVFNKLQEHGVDITGTSIINAYEARQKQFEHLVYWNINGTSGTKLSLRYSLWDRDPTNDLRVIRFCLSVPEGQFVQNGVDRSLIRRSTKNLLPDQVRLNQKTRGIQGTDGVYRMTNSWSRFIDELQQLSVDPKVSEILNVKVIKEAILKAQGELRPGYVFEPDFKVLMRSLIVYRFIKKVA